MKLNQEVVCSVQNGIVVKMCVYKMMGLVSREIVWCFYRHSWEEKMMSKLEGSGNVDEGKCLESCLEVESTGLADGKIQWQTLVIMSGNERFSPK